jgi:hypothetical protein
VQDGFETPLKKRAAPVMQLVVPSTEREIEPLDVSTLVGPQSLDLEMVSGLVIRSAALNLRKYIIMNNLEARGVEPLSLKPSFQTSTCVSDRYIE